MGAPRKYDQETQDRAVRLYREELVSSKASKVAARRKVGDLLGINPATLRNWIEQDNKASAPVEDLAAEVVRLRRENSQLRQANAILKTAAAFFASVEVDRRLA